MDPARLSKWLEDQIAAVAPEKFEKLVSGQPKVLVHKLCELRRFALTGTMEGMAGGASMKVADPAPFVAKIDAHLDTWRERAVAFEGPEIGDWIDESRGLKPRAPPPPRVLRGDPATAAKRLSQDELARIDAFVKWLEDPEATRGSERRVVRIGKPDPAALAEVAELFEETFEAPFPPELAVLLSRANGFEFYAALDDEQPSVTRVDPDGLDPESAFWSTAFDFDGGIEQAQTCYDGGESEFAWPLYGVNFNRLYYATGPASTDERAQLTVWTHLQGQREREKVGTFWEWLELMRR